MKQTFAYTQVRNTSGSTLDRLAGDPVDAASHVAASSISSSTGQIAHGDGASVSANDADIGARSSTDKSAVCASSTSLASRVGRTTEESGGAMWHTAVAVSLSPSQSQPLLTGKKE